MTTDVQSCAKESRDRPKVFDRDVAPDRVMTLFWQHGYEVTSFADLVEATGAKAPTLYAELVNKEGPFRAVLDRYALCFVTKHETVLSAEGKPVDQALRDYFTAVAACSTSKEMPAGCFTINTLAALVASPTDIANTIKSRHAMQEQALTQFLQQRQTQGELSAGRDVAPLAQFLNCVLQGMSISVREGADFDKLIQATDATLCLWPQILESWCALPPVVFCRRIHSPVGFIPIEQIDFYYLFSYKINVNDIDCDIHYV